MSKKRVCKKCGGTGRCWLCNGRKCMACEYTGECLACSARINVVVYGSLALVQDLLGHADPGTTRVYATIYPEELKQAHREVYG